MGEPSELIQPAFDKFWDNPPSRRELQKAFNKIGQNQDYLFGAVDTQALVGNFLCETLGVTKGQLDAYVAKKAAELEEQRKKAEEEAKINA
jgi:hypothetical protein